MVSFRTDCGYYGIHEPECTAKGCCWSPTAEHSKGVQDNPPWCFFPDAGKQGGYSVTSFEETAGGCSYELSSSGGGTLSHLGPDFDRLKAEVEHQTPDRLHVKIAPSGVQRWEVPEDLMPRPPAPSVPPSDLQYTFVAPKGTGEDFSFAVTRAAAAPSSDDKYGGPRRRVQQAGHQVLFNTSGFSFVYKEQYMELTTAVPHDSLLYGLGELTSPAGLALPRDGRMVTLWNADVAASNADINLYGAHAFYMELRPDGQAHGVFLLNSNGMDITLNPDSLTFRVIGGVLDLYFFTGPHPQDVLQQYHDVIGRPMMPPRWTLGFHQSRWGYKNVEELQSVVDSYREAQLPLEVMWSDIDYADRYRMFTLDPVNYPIDKMRAFVDRLHAAGQQWVPIMDCGVFAEPGFAPRDDGVAKGIFIQDRTGQPYLGQVWSGPTYWPDFMTNASWEYWRTHLAALHEKVPFDGLWTDMNEVSNFMTGDVCHLAEKGSPTKGKGKGAGGGARRLLEVTDPKTKVELKIEAAPKIQTVTAPVVAQDAAGVICEAPKADDLLSFPPYRINNMRGAALGTRTIAPTATLAGGTIRSYDAHCLYPLAETAATHAALSSITGRRPFVLTRSSFPGVGRFAAHWTGDNAANFDNLRFSITGVLNSNLWGIPLAGSDICGFAGEFNEELCVRWLSAGAFYPFMRVHSDITSPPREAYRTTATKEAAHKAVNLRYRLLPYLYTAFQQAHVAGGAVARPLFFAAPADAASRAAEGQWLLGADLMIAPVLQASASEVLVTFPPGSDWVGIWDLQRMTGGQQVKVSAPLGDVPVYVRAGGIIPTQRPALTTAAVAASPLSLLVVMPSSASLAGHGKVEDAWRRVEGVGTTASRLHSTGPRAGASTVRKGLSLEAQTQPAVHSAGDKAHGSTGVNERDTIAGSNEAPWAVGHLYHDDGIDIQVGGTSALQLRFTAGRAECSSSSSSGDMGKRGNGESAMDDGTSSAAGSKATEGRRLCVWLRSRVLQSPSAVALKGDQLTVERVTVVLPHHWLATLAAQPGQEDCAHGGTGCSKGAAGGSGKAHASGDKGAVRCSVTAGGQALAAGVGVEVDHVQKALHLSDLALPAHRPFELRWECGIMA